MNDLNKRIYVAGHRGMVGKAIVRCLEERGHTNIITRTHEQLDLTEQAEVRAFFAAEKPQQVYVAAAKVGGIQANNRFPAEFIHTNLMIATNLVHESWRGGVEKLLYPGSSCIYPRLAPQPMTEDALLGGKLEPTNEPYAIAKIAGFKLCESYSRQYGCDFRTVMPTSLYGPGDNFHPENSHVLPAMIRRFHEAKENDLPAVVVWGTGSPKREFLHVDDMARGCVHVMELPRESYAAQTSPMASHINIGTGEDSSIAELAHMVREVVGYEGRIEFDTSKPDGTPRKLLDVSRIRALGWQPRIALQDGLAAAYEEFRNSEALAA